ncbi:MAG: asparagine synthase (glutamine-hydrolyzing) [Patescibacteria group bacterium]|jgi:asparagine synthase (glutamine-hydrolysing)|nr:asparagine synthase (glutamine-hydrolyzing) [Patescibacteria group bacterium]
MCGIAGVWSTNPIKLQERYVEKILEKQIHRGSDNISKITIDDITLGHNRLAIIDLSANANQPFISQCGRYAIVFNGEIYNYLELKNEIKNKFHYSFKTNSDTEVLLISYIFYKEKCLEKLNGAFAFAIYDKKEKILFCARDRIGEKPFIFSENSSGFYFASELGALFSIGIFSSEEDKIGIAYSHLRNFLHIPEPFTKYKEIKRLEPAHAIIVKNKKIIKKWCYWSPSFYYDPKITKEDLCAVIDDAVRIRERADVDVAVLLSGGVDSSIVAGLMCKHGLKPSAFSLMADAEELNRAKKVANLFKIPLHICYYEEEIERKFYNKMTEIYGENIKLFPLVHAAKLFSDIKKNDIKVVMTGNGADEIFYGYDNAYKQLIFSDFVKMIEIFPKKILKVLEKISFFNKQLKILFKLAQIENKKRKGFLYLEESRKKFEYDYNFNELIDYWANKVETNNYIDISHWLALITENSHSITIIGDLPAMMFGIETRSPFLDYRVIEMAFKIDPHKKIRRKYGKIYNKLILREAFEWLLPKEILYAPKKGFGFGLNNLTKQFFDFYHDSSV